jgi:hypothetical protein
MSLVFAVVIETKNDKVANECVNWQKEDKNKEKS